jgi:hypothetical protein
MSLLEPKTCKIREEAHKWYGNCSIHAISFYFWGDELDMRDINTSGLTSGYTDFLWNNITGNVRLEDVYLQEKVISELF